MASAAKRIVRLKRIDRAAVFIITMGGLAVVVGVLGILVFIAAEALPMFRGATLTPKETIRAAGDLTANDPGLRAVGVDEYRRYLFTVERDARIVFYDAGTGTPSQHFPMPGLLPGARVVSSSRSHLNNFLAAGTSDGRVALANGQSKWITSEEARADVQHWRARSGAVLTSAATVLADDPRLDVRIDVPHQPLRVVLDRRRALRKTARILKPPGEALLFAAPTATRKSGADDERLGAARVERLRVKRAHLDLAAVFARLAQLDVNEVLVEAGPRLSGALLAAGLVDEWLLYIAPKLLGEGAKPMASLARLTRLESAPEFSLLDSKAVGPDLRLRLQPKRKDPK